MSWAVPVHRAEPATRGHGRASGGLSVVQYRANAQGEASSGLRPHDCYLALGADKGGRQAAYRELFRYRLDPGLVDEIRAATNGNYSLGSPRCQEQVARAVGRRVVRGRSARPKKQADTATDDLFRSD
jgi:putative transposase